MHQPQHPELTDLVRRHLRPGDSVYIGNFGAQLFAVGETLIREKYEGLHVIAGSGGILLDALIGARVADRVTFAHCWNPVGPAPAYNLRRAAETGDPALHITELSFGMLCAAFEAAAHCVPFQAVAISDATGYVTDDWTGGALARVDSPFGAAFVVRALAPDVAFVHADTVDALGNAYLAEPYGEQLFAAQAARTTIVVAERLLAPGERLEQPAQLAGVHVTAAVEVPRAAWPDGTPGRYGRDVGAYARYAAQSRTPEEFAAWVGNVRAGGVA